MQRHVIVDGSNIATEGRTQPSLAQLNEAVTTFMKEHPHTVVTVVVDATFGHRISKKELAEFDQAIENNELVAPPAGAIGRGDAFVLGIADKVNGSVISNDSYQEFHGKYPWLFDEGRLIGGKPVPHVGWVFVERLPVRGPTSRRAMKAGGRVVEKTPHKVSPAAFKPMPVPKAPPPKPAATKQTSHTAKTTHTKSAPAKKSAAHDIKSDGANKTESQPKRFVNEVLPFLTFVERHPVGTPVKGVVEAYSAHGATVSIGDIRGYIPLRLLASPTPQRARDVVKIGESVALVVASYTPARRSVEVGISTLVPATRKRPLAAKQTVKKAAAKAPAKVAKTAKKAAKKVAKKIAKKTVSKTATRGTTRKK